MTRFGTYGAASVWILAISSAVLAAEVYEPKGPVDTAELEKGLCDRMPVYVWGFWPRDSILDDSLPADALPRPIITQFNTWWASFVRPEFMPSQSDRIPLRGVRKLHGNHKFLVGTYATRDKKGRVCLKASDNFLGITVTHSKLLPAPPNEISTEQIAETAGRVLNIPTEEIAKFKVKNTLRKLLTLSSVTGPCGLSGMSRLPSKIENGGVIFPSGSSAKRCLCACRHGEKADLP